MHQAALFKAPELPAQVQATVNETETIASILRIVVSTEKEIIIDMTLPAQAALDLQEIMPDEVRRKIASETEFDFKQLKQRLLNSHFNAQEILVFKKEQKSYKIWLE